MSLIERKSKQLNKVIQYVLEKMLTEEEAVEVADLYKEWKPGVKYEVVEGKTALLKYGEVNGVTQLYKVIQTHTSQSDWLPSETPSLYTNISFTEEGYENWKQPLGEHDAYQMGDIVFFEGKLYKSTVSSNVWNPLEHGWVLLN